MGGKSSNSPAPPDPYQTAAAQYGLNTNTAAYNAALNRTGNSNDIGSSGWSITGKDPKTGAPLYSFNTSLAPQFAQQMQQPLNMSGIYGANGVNPTLGGLPQVQNALFNQEMMYLQPQQQLQSQQLDTKLANMGAPIGSEAYNNAKQEMNREQTFQNQSAINSAITGATGQEAQLQNIGLQGLQAQEAAGMYGPQLFNLMNGNAAAANAGNTDIMSAFNNAYQGQLNASNAQNASQNQALGTAASLAAMYMLG